MSTLSRVGRFLASTSLLVSAAVATAPLQYVLPGALPTAENLAAAERKLARLDQKARGRERRLFHGMFG